MSDNDSTSDENTGLLPTTPGREAITVYFGVFVGTVAVVIAAMYSAFIGRNVYALLAVLFIGVPYLLLDGRGFDFERFGLTWRGSSRSILWGLTAAVLTLIPFCFGYYLWATVWLGQDFEFRWSNYYKWPVSLREAPENPGEQPGIWVWSQGQRLTLRIRGGAMDFLGRRPNGEPGRTVARIFGRDLVVSNVAGKIDVEKHSPEPNRNRSVFEVRLLENGATGAVHLEPDESATGPVDFRIKTGDVEGPRLEIYRGRAAAKQGGDYSAGESLTWLFLWVLTQVLFVALPEEYFYRGYLQTRLADAFDAGGTDRTPIWGITKSNATASFLFALGHFLVPVNGMILPNRLSVFFPSIVFGWLREKTGTIAGSVTYHAASNLMVIAAAPHFS